MNIADLASPDPEKIRTILRRATSESSSPMASRGRMRESFAASRFRHAAAFGQGLKDVWAELCRIEKRERRACAGIAARYSEEAAAEILSRPSLGPWSG